MAMMTKRELFGIANHPGLPLAIRRKLLSTLSAQPTATTDLGRRETRKEKQGFDRVRRAERRYAVQLRKIARQVGDIVRAFPIGDPQSDVLIRRALREYADLLTPWARATAAAMLADVSRRDERVWAEITKGMGLALRQQLRRAPLGEALRAKMAEQVELITSLPIAAAERVHRLTIEGLSNATRASEIAKEILRTGEVTESRATLIARTEVGRASTVLTEVRATSIGSEGYIWRTARDSDVRESHRKLEGKFIAWDDPPTTDGMIGHAGTLPNCRCYCEVILPNSF